MTLTTSGAVVIACGTGAETSGRRLELATRVDSGALTFTNAFGWHVELKRVLVSIGPLAYLEGAPVALRGAWTRGLAGLRRAFGVSVAHAHPGHYLEGGTLGEMLVATSVDLAAGATDLGVSPGVTGNALSARYSFQAPPAGPFAEALAPHVVSVEGIATAEGASRPFRAVADVDDVLDPEGRPEVLGCELRGGPIDANGIVTLTIDPGVWFDQVDFSKGAESADGDPVELDRTQVPHKAFVRGLRKGAAYVFTYVARP